MAPERTPLLAVFRLSADDGRYFAVISAGTAASSFAKRNSVHAELARKGDRGRLRAPFL